MARYKVFLGAPPANIQLGERRDHLEWQMAESQPEESHNEIDEEETGDLYANTIFGHESKSWDLPSGSLPDPSPSQLPTQSPQSSPSRLLEYAQPPPTSSPPRETQETEFESTWISGISSICVYPMFSFSIRSISPLSAALQRARGSAPNAVKASILVVIIDVQGPDSVTIKKGTSEGLKVSRLQLTIGDDDDAVASLTAWRETAERWGNATEEVGLKKGDVVFLGDISAQIKGEEDVMLTASPYLKSSMIICYRTLPNDHEDRKYRPDLRLGQTDMAVRKVSSLVNWFEQMRRGQ